MARDITWYIYEPLSWQKTLGYQVNMERCRHQVPDGGRSVGFHQCSRKAVEQVDGYWFCKMHAKRVREALGYD